MENLNIVATKRTPEIKFNTCGNLSINGVSIPENVNVFYQPALEWLDQFKETHPENLNITIQFEYMNTSSTSYILKLLKRMVHIPKEKKSVNIKWKYEADDDDMYEQGNILQCLIDHKFEFETH